MGRFAGLNIPNMAISLSGENNINPQNFKTFSFFAIGIISVFASMIISIINKGDIKSGLKYIPVFLTASIIAYIVAMNMLSGVFAGLAI